MNLFQMLKSEKKEINNNKSNMKSFLCVQYKT